MMIIHTKDRNWINGNENYEQPKSILHHTDFESYSVRQWNWHWMMRIVDISMSIKCHIVMTLTILMPESYVLQSTHHPRFFPIAPRKWKYDRKIRFWWIDQQQQQKKKKARKCQRDRQISRLRFIFQCACLRITCFLLFWLASFILCSRIRSTSKMFPQQMTIKIFPAFFFSLASDSIGAWKLNIY